MQTTIQPLSKRLRQWAEYERLLALAFDAGYELALGNRDLRSLKRRGKKTRDVPKGN